MNLEAVSKEHLFELLGWAVDGIDGYQSEHGDLHPYWNEDKIHEARSLISQVTGGELFCEVIQTLNSTTSR